MKKILKSLPANLAQSFLRKDGTFVAYRYELTIIKLHDSDKWEVAYKDNRQHMTYHSEMGEGLEQQLLKLKEYVEANVGKQ